MMHLALGKCARVISGRGLDSPSDIVLTSWGSGYCVRHRIAPSAGLSAREKLSSCWLSYCSQASASQIST
ncbi:hypothetical protein LX13_002795 [Williamsia maris]|uniref:Uncharacterized protein n=1 Tax=Williamsia maris TaxID=72806 RepID=A0ABT1HFE2_9NOCA|nr:hypothetical protein [Williamsia maris]